ncbi:MAG: thioredoxin domain-containing protein [Gemmatimonadetes bacterium]|nr:thioredoxin domain-containing protein [Gemmatimonadota bacterium]
MKKRSWQVPSLLIAGALGGWLLSTFTGEVRGDSESTEVLAEVGGVEVTRAQVERTSPEAFLPLARQHHEMTERSLVQAVRIKLVEVEAAARGIPPTQLVEEEVYAKAEEPTDDDIERIYRRSGSTAPLDQVREQIRGGLTVQSRETRYEEFLAELRERHPVVNWLEPMREAVADGGFPSKGADDAPVTIVEFADFQCPYCRQLESVLGQVMEAYGEHIRFVYRHFPLTSIHPGARIAAEASMCADEQGRFWDLHSEMFAAPAAISGPRLKQIAIELDMDAETFGECLDSKKYAEHVARDEAEARALGLTGTPGLFINGRFIAGVPEAEQLAAMIVDELQRAGEPVEARRLEPIRVAVEADGFPAKGPDDAPVTIVEWADFQCPFCKRILPAVEQVLETYGDQVRFVYRQYPIAQLHPEAEKAAEASLCAHAQGRFWAMHDAMFEDQAALAVPDLRETARRIGLDGPAFDRCLDSGQFAGEAAADLAAGRRAGVTGTPAMFINGRMLGGLQSFESIAEIIDDELARIQ